MLRPPSPLAVLGLYLLAAPLARAADRTWTEAGTERRGPTRRTGPTTPCPNVELEGDVPALGPSAPNPFAITTTAPFGLPGAGRVRLSLYDVPGREVAVLADGGASAGWHAARVDGAGLAVGLYVLRLETGGTSRTHIAVRVR